MGRYLHRYVDDLSEPTKGSVARDVVVRGVLPSMVLLGGALLFGEFLLPTSGVGDEAALNQTLQLNGTPATDLIAITVSHLAGVVGAPLTALTAFFVLKRRTGQWWLSLVPLISVGLEAIVYQTATLLVGRRRPEGVEQMDFGIPYGSFPSGHVGAAACLVTSFALLTFASRRPRWQAWAVVGGGAAWVAAVAVSRLYLGMHYLSDAASGAVIGVISALIGWQTISRRSRAGR